VSTCVTKWKASNVQCKCTSSSFFFWPVDIRLYPCFPFVGKASGTMLVFLLDCLHFSKLLKLHQTEGRISSNLLKRKQSSRKTSIVCRWLNSLVLRSLAERTWLPDQLAACRGRESRDTNGSFVYIDDTLFGYLQCVVSDNTQSRWLCTELSDSSLFTQFTIV